MEQKTNETKIEWNKKKQMKQKLNGTKKQMKQKLNEAN